MMKRGYTHAQYLDKIRRHPAMAALIRAEEPGTPQAMATA